MRYWWVNQNQTYRQEQAGGYIWSPKRNKSGAKNPFYETMREVSPGDIVFSFVDTAIPAIGVAQSYCWESPKPTEFGTIGDYWEDVGWKVRVKFAPLLHRIYPKEHMGVLRGLLTDRYGPLQPNGNGKQGVYLTAVSKTAAEVLAGLIGRKRSRFWPLSPYAPRCKPATILIFGNTGWRPRLAGTIRLRIRSERQLSGLGGVRGCSRTA